MQITWQIKPPSSASENWYRWSGKESHALVDALRRGKNAHGQNLQEVVIATALDLQLSRKQGWDISQLDPAAHSHFQQTAAIYKRGVPVRGIAGVSAEGSYPVRWFDDVQSLLADLACLTRGGAGSSLIIDQRVAELYPALRFHCGKRVFYFNAEEGSKTLASVAAMQGFLASTSPEHLLVIIGGGITGDTAAFAAHLAQRAFILVPTTLLAMVDASVGGKTGVNVPPFGKNLVGAFAFPKQVLLCPAFLDSLPVRELRSGVAECLKHALLSGTADLLAATSAAICEGNRAAWLPLLPELIAVKARIVAEDTTEHGVRAVLNLGHTLGHALETVSQQAQSRGLVQETIRHGEAVGVGLHFALQLSRSCGELSQQRYKKYQAALLQCGCVLSRDELQAFLGGELDTPHLWDELATAMRNDKKSAADSAEVNFILLTNCSAEPAVVRPLSLERLKAEWELFLSPRVDPILGSKGFFVDLLHLYPSSH